MDPSTHALTPCHPSSVTHTFASARKQAEQTSRRSERAGPKALSTSPRSTNSTMRCPLLSILR
eukprot:1271040-Rhodomonas_salina.4